MQFLYGQGTAKQTIHHCWCVNMDQMAYKENQLFGNARIDKRHFSDFAASHSTLPDAGRAEAQTVGMMNPMNDFGRTIPCALPQTNKNHLVSKEYLMKKIRGFIAVLAIGVSACTTTAATTDPASKQKDAVATGQQSHWDSSYGGADKSYDTELLQLREQIAPRFQTLTFNDDVTGKTMTYNLYIPADDDQGKIHPLVLFMADGSTTGKGSEAPLKQGYGGIIWAMPESQAEHPCFVLVPAYTGPENAVNDNWEVSDEVDMTLRLLNSVVSRHNIDKNRLYTTGQSMGGMISFYLNANHPDLFAASIFVASQWDIHVLEPLADKKFFYIVSAADPKASVGMRELGEMLKGKGVAFGTTEFSAKLPDREQENDIQNLLREGHDINFVQFTAGTVTPTGARGAGAEHMYSFDYAYKLEAVRNWLFQQTKDTCAGQL